MITKLEQLIPAVVSRGKRRMAVAYANDAHTLAAVSQAVDLGIIEAVLLGDPWIIEDECRKLGIDHTKFKIHSCDSDMECVTRAVKMINFGDADALMKGLVSTDKYMRGILSKDGGLVPPKGVLSHVSILEIPTYHKLLIVGDVAVIPNPDLTQKIAITNYLISTAHTIGIEMPKVAIITPTEQMLANIPSCVDAAILSKMSDRGQIRGAYVDGPMAFDVAIDKEVAEVKKLQSHVSGDADCIVFPNLDAGNAVFKSLTKFCGAKIAAMVAGANAPCVLTSRGDSEESKLYSIALAALSAK